MFIVAECLSNGPSWWRAELAWVRRILREPSPRAVRPAEWYVDTMSDVISTRRFVPSEKQLALFRAVEDIHDLTQAITVLLVDGDGALIAVSGDENDVPDKLRAVLSGKQLAEAGSVRVLLEDVDLAGSPLNVTVYDVDGTHVLAILFDAEADFGVVQQVGSEARQMLAEILAAPLES
jgi:predicted regulator of Ras-like GTPase activity (Roadblock/LC7/MglB family)